jgi:hypothetical protein
MFRTIVRLSLVVAATAAAAFASSAYGAAQRTFVASYGLDANPCNLALPCRSFNAALAQTNPGGEVVILDTAAYGPMTITKSVKVIGPSGVYGGISVLGGAASTTGVVINAGDTDDVTLRGLDITGVPGTPPLPLIGVDIQNAGAVHIEKTSIGNFPEDNGACIQMTTTKTVRLYVVDSFLRHCLVGIAANGSAVSTSRSGVFVDNTRIERGFNANPASSSIGLWVRGFINASLRNSMISRNTTAVQLDADLANAGSTIDVINSELTQNTNGIRVTGTAGNAGSQLRIDGSQITNLTNDAVNVVNSAIGRNIVVGISGSNIAGLANAVTLVNNAADTNTRVWVEMNDSQVNNITNAIDLSTANGGKAYGLVRDSTVAHVNTVLKTRGSSTIAASLIRTQIDSCTIAVDHGFGVVRLDGNHIVQCANDFVNNGSGNIVSINNNLVYNVDNLSGFTYITPAIIPTK